jgi:DNA invertase Pin-like site-specific DNA recombinase
MEAQRRRIEERARMSNWGTLTWAVDDGWSGKNLDRPALTRVLDQIGPGDRLIVAKLDRLSRSVLDFVGLLGRSRDGGWSVVVLELDLDTSTAVGRFVVTTLAAVAELERGLISERTSAALQAARARGKRLGVGNRTMPAETLARIVELREEGLSFARVAERLTADGIPPARGGTRWHPSAVRAALRTHALDQEAALIIARSA